LACAAHTELGQAHAEKKAIDTCKKSGSFDQMHTICVTLEPCTHFGRTAPCADLIVTTPIQNIRIGCQDPNPKAMGGAKKLTESGRHIALDICETECFHQLSGFLTQQKLKRPEIAIKIATQHSGSMIPVKGEKTFTSKKSLTLAHIVRKKSDAIVTGAGTILADRPLFTVRHVTDFSNKRRFLLIFDRSNRLKDFDMSCYEPHFEVCILKNFDDFAAFLEATPLLHLLVEAGPQLTAEFLRHSLWDYIIHIQKNEGEDLIVTGRNKSHSLWGDHPRFFDLNLTLPQGDHFENFATTESLTLADTIWNLPDFRVLRS
jgi:diaminohydroxyphosphoribosylaminopyrimidine deaminase/5-amino-6-(5-phosphoribosylamino)uracil reductase